MPRAPAADTNGMAYPETNYPHLPSADERIKFELARIGCDAINYSGSRITVDVGQSLHLLNSLTGHIAADALANVRKGASARTAARVLGIFCSGMDAALRMADEQDAQEKADREWERNAAAY